MDNTSQLKFGTVITYFSTVNQPLKTILWTLTFYLSVSLTWSCFRSGILTANIFFRLIMAPHFTSIHKSMYKWHITVLFLIKEIKLLTSPLFIPNYGQEVFLSGASKKKLFSILSCLCYLDRPLSILFEPVVLGLHMHNFNRKRSKVYFIAVKK